LWCLNIADKPSLPVITDYFMDNWKKYKFTWTHGDNGLKFNTTYFASFQNRYTCFL